MPQDLRSYLDLIKQNHPEDFLTVSREVDPAFEITAITVKLEQQAKRRPILLFEKVKGTKFPVLTNLHASRARLAMAINAKPQEMQKAYLRAMEKPIAPKTVSNAPVKEVILTGDQINLYNLPQILHHEQDAGAYITAAISFAKDPNGESWNCAYNRLMIQGRDRTSIHLTLAKHLWEFQRAAEARGEALPVAFAIGVHPAIALGCLAIGSIDEDERAIMGGLLGEPLELVKCETSDLLVPAHAEMIIEAEILPHERTPEGPFGEFTGYSLGERQREVVKVRAITHRRDATFLDITVGHLDHLMLMKRVIVVDHDVDIFNDRQVNWAVATRCQPDRDIVVITNTRGSDLDPSTKEDGNTAKWGVDATAKPSLAAYTPRHRVPKEVWQRINLKDFVGK